MISRRQLLQSAALSGLSLGAFAGNTRAARRDEMPMTGTFNPALKSFDDTMMAHMQKGSIPGGALAVVKDGQLIYARGYGYADTASNETVKPASLFRIASISKPFTSAAIMTLIQDPRNELSLDTQVFALLKIKPHLEPGAKIDPRLETVTIRHLLQHSGGWDRDKSGDVMFMPLEIAKTVDAPAPANQRAIIRYTFGKPLDFDPGTRMAYSNFGYCVLGRVIEKVSGLSYEAYVQRNVLGPLGIRRMRLGRSLRENQQRNEVCYYQPGEEAISVFPESQGAKISICYGGFNMEALDSHGGWLASAVDLARFAAALDVPKGNSLLTPESEKAMYARPAPPVGQDADGKPSAAYYALGWEVRPVGNEAQGKRNTWHSGSLPGTSTLLVRRWDGLTWGVVFNHRPKDEMAIDPALHEAAAKVKDWPDVDLFPKFG